MSTHQAVLLPSCLCRTRHDQLGSITIDEQIAAAVRTVQQRLQHLGVTTQADELCDMRHYRKVLGVGDSANQP